MLLISCRRQEAQAARSCMKNAGNPNPIVETNWGAVLAKSKGDMNFGYRASLRCRHLPPQ